MAKPIKTYRDFRGGWVTDVSPDNLADSELLLVDNVDLGERGALKTRKGTAPLNTVSYGAEVERIIEWPRKDGTKVLLAVIGSTLASIADDGTKTDIKALDSAEMGYFFYADKFYFTGKESGTDKYWQYDGTTVSEVTPNAAGDNDLTPIKRCRIFLWHTKSQRIFAARDASDLTALYYSEPGDPTYFKGTSKLYPTTGDGPVSGLALFGEAMVTVYQNSEWTYKGVSPDTDAVWIKLPSEHGTVAPKSIKLTPNSLTFLGRGGIISLSPGLIDYSIVMLTGDELIKNRAKDKVLSVIRSITNQEITCAVYDNTNDRYLLAYTDTPGATRNDKVLVLDWGLQSFVRYTGWQANDMIQRANGDILIATNGYIMKAEQGYKDWDPETQGYKAINYHIKTKQWDLDFPVHQKKTKRFFLAAKQYDIESSSVDITISAGYKPLTFENVPLDESFVWGEEWDLLWGYTDYIMKEAKCKLKGARFQVDIENSTIDQPVTIYGVAFEYRVKKAKGVKVDA